MFLLQLEKKTLGLARSSLSAAALKTALKNQELKVPTTESCKNWIFLCCTEPSVDTGFCLFVCLFGVLFCLFLLGLFVCFVSCDFFFIVQKRKTR